MLRLACLRQAVAPHNDINAMKFIVAKELGRLAKWLRIMGYDALYFDKDEKRELIIKSLREERVILTRDSKLSKYSGIRYVHINSDFVEEQVKQILTELNIKPEEKGLFSRCVICNKGLVNIEKEKVKDKIAPYVYETQEVFMSCPVCNRIYWQGTHWGNVRALLEKIRINRDKEG